MCCRRNFFERNGPSCLLDARRDLPAFEGFREVIHVNEFITEVRQRAGNYVFQLANIAGQASGTGRLRTARKPLNLLGVSLVVLLEKILDEQGNIIQTLAQLELESESC